MNTDVLDEIKEGRREHLLLEIIITLRNKANKLSDSYHTLHWRASVLVEEYDADIDSPWTTAVLAVTETQC